MGELDPVAGRLEQPALLGRDEAGGRRRPLDDLHGRVPERGGEQPRSRAGGSSAIAPGDELAQVLRHRQRPPGSSAGAGPSARAISSANSGLPPDAWTIFSSAGRRNA